MIATRLVIGATVAVLGLAGPEREPTTEHVDVDPNGQLAVMERRAHLLGASIDGTLTLYRRDVLPLELALLSTGRVRDPMQARWAAWALVRESGSRHLSPMLLTAIMQVENPWLVTDTTSGAGAVGWMQVMPMHVRDDHPCGTDLTDGAMNVCYGADIWRTYLGRALDEAITKALLKYSGCVRTPGCEVYADRVLALVND